MTSYNPEQNPTIGYGHLINSVTEWEKYKNGITGEDALTLLDSDITTKGTNVVNKYITARLTQYQYDALVIFAFNIGETAFARSTVRKMINNPKGTYSYKTIDDAWMAYNKQKKKFNHGLCNRRYSELQIYKNSNAYSNYIRHNNLPHGFTCK